MGAPKLKPAPDPTLSGREALAAAHGEIASLKGALDTNARDQDEARAEIRRLENQLDEANKAVASAPALEKRALKAQSDALAEKIDDYRTHLLELQKARGHYPGCLQKDWRSIEAKLEMAEGKAREALGATLQASPNVAALLSEYAATNAHALRLEATLRLIQSAGGIERKGALGADWWRAKSANVVEACAKSSKVHSRFHPRCTVVFIEGAHPFS